MHTIEKRIGGVVLVGLLSLSALGQIQRWDDSTVIPGTESITPGPGLLLANWNTDAMNLRYADFDQVNLQGSDFHNTWLESGRFTDADASGVDFSQANLSHADFYEATLTNANFNGAIVKGATFGQVPGLTSAQLYSTASYQSRDLSGVTFRWHSLRDWDFSGQDLTGATFETTLLFGVSFRGANLNGATFKEALFGVGDEAVDFSGATIRGANFAEATQTGFTAYQLSTTASYQALDLREINFQFNNMGYWNLRDQRLTDVDFSYASMTSVSLKGADLRGANLDNARWVATSSLDNLNTIMPDGHIDGLTISDLGMPPSLGFSNFKVRDYEGGIGITVDKHFTCIAESTIEIYFEDADWGSTMALNLDAGAMADLDGTLWLGFLEDTDVAALVGQTFDVFDWNGCLPDGETFADVATPVGYEWDLRDLYVGGTVTLLSIPEPATVVLLVLASLAVRRR